VLHDPVPFESIAGRDPFRRHRGRAPGPGRIATRWEGGAHGAV